jgi:hypothetical protein
MVDADIVTQDNEVIEARENINVENADEEVCRLMREMPKWTAGIKDGRPYIATIHYEIQFKL